jgi:hypothetical protein
MTLFNRVRGRLSGVQAEGDPHEWRLPTSYSSSRSTSSETVIPNPGIFRNAFVPSDPTLRTTESSLIYPDISHAAVHLALLECFRKLRLSASRLDVELHVPPVYEKNARPGARHGPVRLPESERWDLLIRLAVTRFTAWWLSIDQVFHHATAYTHYAGDKSVVQLTKNYLPPLDVLLVWYVFMLDHEDYALVCNDREMPKLLQLCFPWPAIRDLIDMETLTFNLPRPAQNLFSTLSSQSADILTYLDGPPAYTEATGLPLQLKLFDQVKKREAFIDDAHELLWIRAPSLKGSLERASVDYLKYQVSATHSAPGLAVPFGVGLMCKTHKLYPFQYQLFRGGMIRPASQSDSKLPLLSQITVSSDEEAHEHTATECLCWTCERIRDVLPDFEYDKARTSAPGYNVALFGSLSSEQIRSIKDDLGFYHAVEAARQNRQPLPTRPPTAAEKAAQKLEAQKQKEAGVLPGLNEYLEVLPNGKWKIRRVKHANAASGLSFA